MTTYNYNLDVTKYFSRFGINLADLALDLGRPVEEIVPVETVDDLRPVHIHQLMDMVDADSDAFVCLKSTLTPRELLNPGSVLTQQIWRMVEFSPKERLDQTVVRGLILREEYDVLFDGDRVYSQLKVTPGKFRGMSCSLRCPMDNAFALHRQASFPTDRRALKVLTDNISKSNGSISVRPVVGLYLDVGDNVPSADWTVDADDMDPGHITIAVANDEGLIAKEPKLMIRKVYIPALNLLPWKQGTDLLVLKAEAEWRDDFLPYDDRWSNIADVLNMILCDGDMDDFWAVWAVHDMIHRSNMPDNAMNVHRHNLQRILEVLQSYERSDRHDINDPARALYKALADVRAILST